MRDFLMDISPVDYDLTTNARPEQILQVFAHYRVIPTGLAHGTVTVVLGKTSLEITSYRTEGGYTDGRRPDQVSFVGRLEEDLSRRDFTINAMAWHPQRGLLDYVGGRKDLEARIIRSVGQADRRFQEDGLRLLRALRFAASLDFHLEYETRAALFRNQAMLRKISPERIRQELTKMLCGKAAGQVFLEYWTVLLPAIPELGKREMHLPNTESIAASLAHTAFALEKVEPQPVLRWSIFLYNLRKILGWEVRDNQLHFGEGSKGAEGTDAILRSLKFDTATRKRIVTLVAAYDAPIEKEKKDVHRWMSRLGSELFFQLLAIKRAEILAQGPAASEEIASNQTIEVLAREVLSEKLAIRIQDLAVNGNDLLALGYQGKELGASLGVLFDAVLEERVPNQREALLQFLCTEYRAGSADSAE